MEVRLVIKDVRGNVMTDEIITEQVLGDPKSCADRLATDAYVVTDIAKEGKKVDLTTGVEPKSESRCPEGTINDTEGMISEN